MDAWINVQKHTGQAASALALAVWVTWHKPLPFPELRFPHLTLRLDVTVLDLSVSLKVLSLRKTESNSWAEST